MYFAGQRYAMASNMQWPACCIYTQQYRALINIPLIGIYHKFSVCSAQVIVPSRMWANWILYWSVFVLHVIHSKRVRCWQKRMNRHLSISRRRMNALSSMMKKQQQQQQHRENKWLNILINHYAYMFHIWWCQRHTYTHAFIKLTEKERKRERERENSILSVKYIGNCLLNYACMTEPFDGIVVVYYAQHTKLQMCILYIWIYVYENGMLYRFDRT